MRKVYLAGRVSWGDNVLSDFAAELESRGHEIAYKWWELGRLPKPYLENLKSSQEAAATMTKAVVGSDVMILFAEDNVTGAATELGIALGDSTKSREIVVIAPENVRQQLFYAHPAVTVVYELDGIRKLGWY